jgi:phosphatidylserine decarboxylase
LKSKKIFNRLPVAWEGIPYIAICLSITIILFLLNWLLFALAMTLLSAFIVYFFRDLDRPQVHDEAAILTPADGKVLAIDELENGDDRYPNESKKISIFMSLFNAHINRIPINGTITDLSYHPGKFFSANMDKASVHNEHNILTLDTQSKARIVFVQIAGFIARRIACWVKKGDVVKAGQRFGLIRFGSRLEVYLPPHCTVLVTKGQKVKAGQSVLGYLDEIGDEQKNEKQK